MIGFKERDRGTKWHHRTPRARINRLGGDRVAYKEANWFKNNWKDDRAKWAFNGIERFLKVNIGRPVNKVFSEFLERCDKSTKSYNLKKIFYDHIKEKDEITWYGGFYVTNGILNYKKGTSRPKSCEPLSGYINTNVSIGLIALYNERKVLQGKGIKETLVYASMFNRVITPYDVFAGREDNKVLSDGTCGMGIYHTFKRYNEGNGYGAWSMDKFV